jgi:hypothetical protein
MLDSHPRLSVLDEMTFFNGILRLRPAVPDLAAAGAVERFFALLPRLDQYRYWNGMEDVLAQTQRRLLADERPSYPKLYLYAMEAHAARCGKRRYGDKTPENVRHLDELAAMFGRAQFVHIVRDPRANVASRAATEWSSADVLSNTMKWRLDVTAASRFAATAPAGRYLELHYEDLVTSPEAALGRVCAFLGETFEPAMLASHRTRVPLFRNSGWKEGVLRPVSTAPVARWRTELGMARVGLIQAVAGEALQEHGYAPVAVPLLDRLGAALLGPAEIGRWLRFRLAARRRRRAAADVTFHAGNAPLWATLRRSVGTWARPAGSGGAAPGARLDRH